MFKHPPPLQNGLVTFQQLMYLFTPYHLQTCYTLFPSTPTIIILMFKHQPPLQNGLITLKQLMYLFTPYHLKTCYTLFPSIQIIILMFKHQPPLQKNLPTKNFNVPFHTIATTNMLLLIHAMHYLH